MAVEGEGAGYVEVELFWGIGALGAWWGVHGAGSSGGCDDDRLRRCRVAGRRRQ